MMYTGLMKELGIKGTDQQHCVCIVTLYT